MEAKSIEQIWDRGFLQQPIQTAKINNYLDVRSINVVEKLCKSFSKGVNFNLLAVITVFALNIWLDNDHAILWGIIGSLPALFWFGLGRKQLHEIKQINYQNNCYEYLKSVHSKMEIIRNYNLKTGVISIPVILTPLLIYTFYNQQGKTLGQVFGINGMDLSLGWIFVLIPLLTVTAYFVSRIILEWQSRKPNGIDTLIKEMEIINTLK
ncbi:hypothetical protein [Portibacter marinus]|uniref:hypothetical protein n=1 Tax=Portibacter marinus TaxID=2898660 RepID=UPI001F29D15D|nr:hypothetical protein [Portibacter marinus]